MKFEIERKFLLKNDGWRAAAVSASKFRDGLLSCLNGNKVRVRRNGRKGTLTIKGPKNALSRVELEYDIPLREAEYLLSTLCGADVCSKTRYFVPHGVHVWHVDVYEDVLDGFLLAEIELAQQDERFALPGWVGREVTSDPSYGKWATLARRNAGNDSANSNVAYDTGPEAARLSESKN